MMKAALRYGSTLIRPLTLNNATCLSSILVCHSSVRQSHQQPVTSTQIAYNEHGDPKKVLQIRTQKISAELRPGQVMVRWLAAPINPADINQIQGIYPLKPVLPAVGGNEGVAVVESVAPNVVTFKPGDWCIPSLAGGGTWQTHSVHSDHELLKINYNLSLEQAATMMVNPCTAYRMLHDFASLTPGDVIIQNGASSAVGRFVIQICRIKHYKTINIIRERPDRDHIERVKAELTALGADHVLTEKEMRKSGRALINKLENVPKLALNCVGGDSTAFLASYLQENSNLVTYGGMSRRPLLCPAGPLIFKNIQMHGFWMSRWLHDFASLTPGDVIIQNGASSAVGRFVIQICRIKHYKTINIIRERPDRDHIERVKAELTALGADHVLTEKEMRKSGRALINKLENVPKLALNCVGGDSTAFLASYLQENSNLVTYGGMSRRPLLCPAGPLIFKNIQMHGFWMSRWSIKSTDVLLMLKKEKEGQEWKTLTQVEAQLKAAKDAA